MANEKNLKPFKKGQSGNLEQLVHVIYEKALSGDMRAVEFIADRLEGKVAHRLQVSPANDKPIKVFSIEGVDPDFEKENS